MLGKRLGKLRDEKGLSQGELAKRLGIARTTYSGYENNAREPDQKTLDKLATFFDVSVDYLLGRTDSKRKDPADQLIEYLDLELTDDEIIERMTFKIDNMTLTDDEVKEFIAFVRAKRFMKSGQTASKPQGT